MPDSKISLSNFFKAIDRFRAVPVLPNPYHKIWRYFSVVIVISLALFVELHSQNFNGHPSLLMFAAVIFSTWYAGFWPGLITIVLAVLSMDYFFTKPLYVLTLGSNYIVQSTVFIFAAVLISSLIESQHRAEEAVRELVYKQKRFIADASHELFTPLSVIKAQSEVVLQDRTADAAGLKETISSNVGEVDRMTRIVENLLELSRSEIRAKEQLADRIELREFIKNLLNKVKILADGKNLVLTMSNGDEGAINGDSTSLTHLAINLLQNAIQYTPAGGRVEVGVFAKDKVMDLVVKDTGMGIAPEHLSRIFDPFYKTDAARRSRQSGAGLGLSIVKAAADLHRAKIKVESRVNFGTTVAVEFLKV